MAEHLSFSFGINIFDFITHNQFDLILDFFFIGPFFATHGNTVMFGGDVFMFPERTRQYGSTMQGPQQRAPSKTVNVVLISELEP